MDYSDFRPVHPIHTHVLVLNVINHLMLGYTEQTIEGGAFHDRLNAPPANSD